MLNIIVFILGTLLYYYLKPPPTLGEGGGLTAAPRMYSMLGLYFVCTLILQYACNIYAVKARCGGDIADNIGAVLAYTIFPWVLVFGISIVAALSFPEFKRVFSDVVGYFAVYSKADKLFSEMMVNGDVDRSSLSADQKKEYEAVSELILQICGNPGILVNQIVPSNFTKYWTMLQPLMKDQYKVPGAAQTALKQRLLDLVVRRNNVGEFVWYMYTGVLVVSLVQLKLSQKKCNTNVNVMESKYQAYLDTQEKANKKTELAKSTVYTV